MKIGGLQKFSLIDYPGKICAVLFTQGCNFRCSYCHNPELVNPRLYGTAIPEEEFFKFLSKRQEKLDAVVVTGGEPAFQADLVDFISEIKAMNFLVKIDTNGSCPQVIEELIEGKLVDYIAMDVKAPLERYGEVTASPINPLAIEKSIGLIMKSGIDYEFRTTVVKSLLSENDIVRIGETVAGARKLILQKFIPSKTLDEKFLTAETYSDEDFEEFKRCLSNHVNTVAAR